MLEWLSQIGDFLLLIVNVVITFLSSTVKLLTMIPQWLSFLHLGTASLPGIIAPFIICGITLTAVLLILGRH